MSGRKNLWGCLIPNPEDVLLGMGDYTQSMRTNHVEDLLADASAIQSMISSGMSAIDDLVAMAGDNMNDGKAADLLRLCTSLGQMSGLLLWLTENREGLLREAMEVPHA